jgi:riboflavin-specific deaminase-like protein
MEFINTWMLETEKARKGVSRPLVSLCYAQSLDGSLTAQAGKPTALSGPDSSKLTHWLRAYHDAILVGVGTVLADNPQLTVRLVTGNHPQPIILDSRLQTPPSCYLIKDHPKKAWIVTSDRMRANFQEGFEDVRFLYIPCDQNGHVSLKELINYLGEIGIRRLMVEGGVKIISSFLSLNLANQVILTIAPRYTGGLHIGDISRYTQKLKLPALREVQYQRLGDDLIVLGKF